MMRVRRSKRIMADSLARAWQDEPEVLPHLQIMNKPSLVL
jgi:hypothetical protein